jgi:aspartyl-tRNA(Asn)/glutamyl-tRNA(Gln) amidotransferase subunit C
MISKEDIAKLAKLARLTVADAEQEGLAKDLESIVGYISDLSKLSIPSHTEVSQTLLNVMREDSAPHESGAHTEALLAEAPETQGEYFKVKNIF